LNPLKKLAGQTGIYGLSTIVGRFLNYLLVPLYTYVFEPDSYGIVIELYGWVAILLVIFLYGFETSYFRHASKSDDSQHIFNVAFTSVFTSSIIFSGFILLASSAIANAMGYGSNPEYIRWFAVIICLDAISAIPFARLRLEGRAIRFGVLKLANIGVNIGLNLFFLVACPLLVENGSSWVNAIYDPSITVGYIFISNLVATVLTLLLLLPSISPVRLKFDGKMWRSMFSYAWPLLIVGLAGMINDNFGRAAMKYLITPEHESLSQVGIYGACLKLSVIMILFVQAFRYAAEPFFFSQHGQEGDKQIYADVMKYFVVVMATIFLGVMLYLDIIKYFISEAYHEGLMVVPILLMAQLFLGIFYNLSVWYKVTDRTIFGGYLALIGLVITLIGNIYLVPRIGFIGSAWTTFACYGVMMIGSYLVGQRFYRVPYPVSTILLILAVAIASYSASEWLAFTLDPTTGMKLLLNTGIFLAFVSILFLLFRTGRSNKAS
jgi:O-antigen/teichoic acid export membrane protein